MCDAAVWSARSLIITTTNVVVIYLLMKITPGQAQCSEPVSASQTSKQLACQQTSVSVKLINQEHCIMRKEAGCVQITRVTQSNIFTNLLAAQNVSQRRLQPTHWLKIH